MNFIKENLVPFVLAMLVHVLLVLFLVFSVDWSAKEPPKPAPENIINAVVIDETKIKAEKEKKRKAEEKKRKAEQEKKRQAEADKKRKADAEKKRKADEKKRKAEQEKKRKAEAEKKRKAKLEKKRKAEAEKKRKAKEKKRKAAQEKKRKAEAEKKRKAKLEKKRKAEAEKKRKEEARRRREEEEAFQRQLDEEQEQIVDSATQRRLARQTIAYKSAIQRDVQRAWRKAPGTKPGMSCVVRVKQIPGGEVVDVNISNCNTDDANFRRSVVNAVYKASPLPRPADSALFERELEFKFTPQE